MPSAHTKIVELFIDDEFDESGIDAISLVSRPAHDEQWLAFNKEEQPEEYSPYKVMEDNFCEITPKLDQLGEPYSQLIEEGWEIVRVEKITPQMVTKMNQERFSSPNDSSELDTDEYRIRFKYVGPRDDKNRKFCADMLRKNRVYRIEDINDLTANVANEEFGYYSIFNWRGSFNCRHTWVRLIYKKSGQIINSGSSMKNRERTETLGPGLQSDTRTKSTKEAVATSKERKTSPQWRPGVPRDGNLQFNKSRYEQASKKSNMERMMFIDEDRHILVGAAMVPNKMIHRYDDLGNLYYVFFSKESIKKMADKFLRQKRTDETSVEHNGIKLGSDKAYITESWVSEDPIKDKSAAYGFNLPAGTWFVSMKVDDPKVWNLIKQKALTGFSVEGLFAEKSVFSSQEKQINQIRQIIKSIKDE
jgi:hypothetical protein